MKILTRIIFLAGYTYEALRHTRFSFTVLCFTIITIVTLLAHEDLMLPMVLWIFYGAYKVLQAL